MLKKFSHAGVAVADLEHAVARYGHILGVLPVPKIEPDPPGLKTARLPVGGSHVDLIQPTISADHPAGGLARFLKKHGERICLLAFYVDGLSEARKHLLENGVALIDGSKLGCNSGAGALFVHPRSTRGVLICLMEERPAQQRSGVPGGLIKSFDHVGMAVRDVDQTIADYHRIFGLQALPRGTPKVPGVFNAKLPVGEGFYIEPLHTAKGYPPPYEDVVNSATFLQRYGEGLYLMTFSVSDIALALKSLQANGIETIDGQSLVGVSFVGFVHPRSIGCSGVRIELVERK